MADEPRRVVNPDRAVAQVTMAKAQKERYAHLANEHGIKLSQMVRLALDEYVQRHVWE